MKKILIIGCGYLGSHLATYFDQQGWIVKIVGRKSMYLEHLSSTIKFHDIDIRKNEDLNSIIEKDDMVLYAAGSINATNAFNDVIQDINSYYLSFVQLLNDCEKKQISKFVFLSSAGTVYGDANKKMSEEDCLNPTNIYGLQKMYFENLIKIKEYESNKLPYVILRVSNPYGGIQNSNKNQGIIPVLINKAISKEPFTFWGNVRATRDFIYIDDFLKATYLSATTQTNQTINISSGVCTHIQEVIEIVQQKVGYDIEMTYRTSNNKIVMHNEVDNTKLINLTGYHPSTSLASGILSMINNIKI